MELHCFCTGLRPDILIWSAEQEQIFLHEHTFELWTFFCFSGYRGGKSHFFINSKWALSKYRNICQVSFWINDQINAIFKVFNQKLLEMIGLCLTPSWLSKTRSSSSASSSSFLLLVDLFLLNLSLSIWSVLAQPAFLPSKNRSIQISLAN